MYYVMRASAPSLHRDDVLGQSGNHGCSQNQTRVFM